MDAGHCTVDGGQTRALGTPFGRPIWRFASAGRATQSATLVSLFGLDGSQSSGRVLPNCLPTLRPHLARHARTIAPLGGPRAGRPARGAHSFVPPAARPLVWSGGEATLWPHLQASSMGPELLCRLSVSGAALARVKQCSELVAETRKGATLVCLCPPLFFSTLSLSLSPSFAIILIG